MDADKPTFRVDLELVNTPIDPIPSNIKSKRMRTTLDYYPKFRLEFYEMTLKCAEYIDKLPTVELKIKYSNELSKIFVKRDQQSIMRLFREIVLAQ